jgi:hypothetical protein
VEGCSGVLVGCGKRPRRATRLVLIVGKSVVMSQDTDPWRIPRSVVAPLVLAALATGILTRVFGATIALYREEPPFDLKVGFGTVGDWKAVVTAVVKPERDFDSDSGPSLSKICFVRTNPAENECTYFGDLFHSGITFQEFSSFSVVRLRSGPAAINGLVMKAEALYPTGQVHETAIWAYDAQRDDFHLVSGQESEEVRIFSNGPLNGTLVTASWHRDEGETRWSDHRRDITVYKYGGNGEAASYRKVLEYTTTEKYGAEDTDTIDANEADIVAKVP